MPSPSRSLASSSTHVGPLAGEQLVPVRDARGGADRHHPRLGAEEHHEPGADRRLGVDDRDAGHAGNTLNGASIERKRDVRFPGA